jgi:hypothetical protein
MYSNQLSDEVFLEAIIVIAVIVIIIIIGETALCELYSFLYKILPDLSVPGYVSSIRQSSFHFFGFCNNNFFYRARLSALCPTRNLKDQVTVCMAPSYQVAQLRFQSLSSLLSPSMTHRVMEVF